MQASTKSKMPVQESVQVIAISAKTTTSVKTQAVQRDLAKQKTLNSV